MNSAVTTIKTVITFLLHMLLSILPSDCDAEASSCIDLGSVSDRLIAVRMAASDNLIAIGFPNEGKVMIFELTDRKKLCLKHVVKPPEGSLFSSNHKGFGHSVAVNGNRVVIGAYRIETSVPQERNMALEYPKGVFITSEVFLFDVRSGKIETLATGDQLQAQGYSVAAVGDTIAWSVFEKPAPSDIPLSLFHATAGGVMVRDMKSGAYRLVKGSADVRGFGFDLASAPDGYLILAPFGKSSEVFRFRISGGDSRPLRVTGLNSPLFANLVESKPFMAISTGELFSITEAKTIVIPNNGNPLTLSHGGRLSASDKFLTIAQPAMHEGAPTPLLYLYRKSKNGEMELVKVKRGIIGATVIGESVVTVGQSFTGKLHLCVE